MNDDCQKHCQTHWDEVYAGRDVGALSWTRAHLDGSLAMLARGGLGPQSRLIDVGGGASTLVDDLLAEGIGSVTVLDLSAAALALARRRVGDDPRANWAVGDVTSAPLPHAAFDAWHDRAVLHFLHAPAAVDAYARQAAHALRAGGFAVIGGFAPDGPERCSGLPVARRSAQQVAAALGDAFVLEHASTELHRTPLGREQAFVYVLLRRAG